MGANTPSPNPALHEHAPGAGFVRLSLAPVQQIEPSEQGYRSTGNHPHFSISAASGKLPTGWAVVRYRGHGRSIPLAPRFVVDQGQGWDEKNPVQLCRHHDGQAEELVKLPDACKAMRLEPMQWDGLFALADVQVREIGKLGVLVYLARKYVANSLENHGLFSAIARSARMLLALPLHGANYFKHALFTDYRKNLVAAEEPFSTSLWFRCYRIKQSQLQEMAQHSWPADAPKFSVVLALPNASLAWLKQTVESVQKQVYQRWELLCSFDASASPEALQWAQALAAQDARIVCSGHADSSGAARINAAIGSASGDYLCVLDRHGVLEPHALFRFAQAALADHAELIYADEAHTDTNDVNDIKSVIARPRFSYDFYLHRPYFANPVALKRSLVLQLGGLDEALSGLQTVDLNLRVLEKAAKVSHVPDILYRVRQLAATAADPELYAGVVHAHLARLGFDALAAEEPLSSATRVRFFPPAAKRVAIVIPTKNRVDLLRVAIDSIMATVDTRHADIVVIDHDSDDPLTKAYLADLAKKHTVLQHSGPFNFARINNCGVEKIKGKYDFYLFMNNDIEARERGWFEAMLDLARRDDVGVVGATLLYANETVQHAGVLFGPHGAAEHAYKAAPFLQGGGNGQRNHGHNGTLVATREYSAVTAACMLMRASLFHEIDGYDENLVVGFNDIDLCLRAGARGYKILNCAQAVLFHHESCSRGKSLADPHPGDTALFIEKYPAMVQAEDPYFSPLLSNVEVEPEVRRDYTCPTELKARTVAGFLPRPELAHDTQPEMRA